MDHPHIIYINAKSRHADVIKSAAAHRQIKARKGEKPALWPAIKNLFRGKLPAPMRREGTSGSLAVGKPA